MATTASWSDNSVTSSIGNHGANPDGSEGTFFMRTNTVANAGKHIRQSVTSNYGQYHTISVYAKLPSGGTNAYNYLYLRLYDPTNGSNFRAWYNISTATASSNLFTGSGAEVVRTDVEYVGNNWYRYSLTGKTHNSSGTGTLLYDIFLSGADNVEINTGDGTSGVLLWGAQVESNTTNLSSFISTIGSTVARAADVSSSVAYTRERDYAKIKDMSFYNYSEGTLYGKYTPKTTSSWRTVARIGASTDTDALYLRISSGDNKEWQAYANNVLQANIEAASSAYTDGTEAVGVGAYKENDFVTAWDGTLIGTDTTAEVPYTVSEMSIGADSNGTNNINGTIKKVAYYPERLSNAELVALTENN
jgi:hypothetical protein